MPVASVSGGSYADSSSLSTIQQLLQEFQQLGKDLKAGNLNAAQLDFVTLQQDTTAVSTTSLSAAAASTTLSTVASSSQGSTTSTTQSSDPIAQAFSQLSKDLQAGNLTAAQQDFTTIQQDFQSLGQGAASVEAPRGHHHHHSGGTSDGASSATSGSSGSSSSQAKVLIHELEQELQSGDLAGAQQTYAALAKDFQSFGQGGVTQSSASSSYTPATSNSISVSA